MLGDVETYAGHRDWWVVDSAGYVSSAGGVVAAAVVQLSSSHFG